MFDLPEVAECRLISLSWVDEQGNGKSSIICAAENLSAEQDFRIEFDKKGWVYDRVIEASGIDLATATHVRITSTILPFLNL
jgi:hypothetical protein